MYRIIIAKSQNISLANWLTVIRHVGYLTSNMQNFEINDKTVPASKKVQRQYEHLSIR